MPTGLDKPLGPEPRVKVNVPKPELKEKISQRKLSVQFQVV